MEIRHYVTATGVDPFQKWLDELKDLQGRIAILRRIDRVLRDNFGDHKFCQDGVWELRVDLGPGYRIYFGRDGDTLIILLTGGTKKRQQRDIEMAAGFWRDYKRTRRSVGRGHGDR